MKNLTLCFALTSVVALASCSGTGTQGATGVAGLPGPEGPAGPMGEKGDTGETGAMGNMGTNGSMGAQGIPGPTLFKRVTFPDTAVDVDKGDIVDLAAATALTFTPPTSGKAVLTARGHCTMTAISATQDNLIDIIPTNAMDITTAFTGTSAGDWGRAMVPKNSMGMGNYLPMFYSEVTVDVTAATAYTFKLAARRTEGDGTNTATCTGSLSVQVFTGMLP